MEEKYIGPEIYGHLQYTFELPSQNTSLSIYLR